MSRRGVAAPTRVRFTPSLPPPDELPQPAIIIITEYPACTPRASLSMIHPHLTDSKVTNIHSLSPSADQARARQRSINDHRASILLLCAHSDPANSTCAGRDRSPSDDAEQSGDQDEIGCQDEHIGIQHQTHGRERRFAGGDVMRCVRVRMELARHCVDGKPGEPAIWRMDGPFGCRLTAEDALP